jgi:hypothetical protein
MSDKTITIETTITVPWFDTDKWEYVPYVDGEKTGEDWQYLDMVCNQWRCAIFKLPRKDPQNHCIRPIKKPWLTPELGYELVRYDPETVIQEDWRVCLKDKDGVWIATCSQGSKMCHFAGLTYARPIPKPSLPPVPDGWEIVEVEK